MSEITKLLIANRGEIAVRIARTARRLGIGTVGVYSEPDARAMHVDAVDVAVALGGATPAESYLRGEAIIATAQATGADAIHPGYGFLAENAGFARDVEAAGLIWVGPTPEQIELLGDKVAAKRAAIEAGVATAPMLEIDGTVMNEGRFEGSLPDDIPLPVLVKAAAGGGGRGMRIVRSVDELGEAIEAASREATAAFGDGTVFVEPYLERGRHIEVQILGDAHGAVVHFGERECSIQRRNQKIVEEAPSAGISAETRAALCDGALALARHVGYRNAGTVEFLVGVESDGSDGTINFLEVNTRLQVEHPVTESVTGVDLVELQLRVASGEPLPLTQGDIEFTGHGIEVRVVAEDPSNGWLPSTGTIGHFSIGDAGTGVRVDTGFAAGATISVDYDSLLAKVIAHGATRAEAARRLARSMRTSQITGLQTNLDTLAAILVEPDYLAAATPTAYLDEHPAVVAAHGPTGADEVALLVAASVADESLARRAATRLAFAPSGWRNLRTVGQRQVWHSARGLVRHLELQVRNDPEQGASESHDGVVDLDVAIGPWPEPLEDGALPPDERERIAVRVLEHELAGEGGRMSIEVDGRRVAVDFDVERPATDEIDLQVAGQVGGQTVHVRSAVGTMSWTLAPRFVSHEGESGGSGPVCPLPGTVIAVNVAAGQHVADGTVLMVVEAMKMEHKITAVGDSIVAEVRFDVGDRVDTGDLLVALEHDEHESV